MLNTIACMPALSVAGDAGSNCSLGALSVCRTLLRQALVMRHDLLLYQGWEQKFLTLAKIEGLVFGTVWANPTPLKCDLHGEPEMYSKY